MLSLWDSGEKSFWSLSSKMAKLQQKDSVASSLFPLPKSDPGKITHFKSWLALTLRVTVSSCSDTAIKCPRRVLVRKNRSRTSVALLHSWRIVAWEKLSAPGRPLIMDTITCTEYHLVKRGWFTFYSWDKQGWPIGSSIFHLRRICRAYRIRDRILAV